MKPRVMIIIAAETVTGPAKGIFQLLESGKAGTASYLLLNFKVNGHSGSSFELEAAKRSIPVHWLEQSGRDYIKLLHQSKRYALAHHINIVQSHGYKPSVIGLYLKYAIGTKWVCFLHGNTAEDFKARAYHKLESFLQLFADRVVLVSESQRRRIIDGMNRSRIHVIHNAVDINQPVNFSQQPPNVRKLLGIEEGKYLVAVIGRLSYEKGVDVFLDAFSQVATVLDDVDALLIGDGKERDNLKRQSRRLGIENRVHFPGHTDTPGDFMLQADLVVVPSRSEGMPNVVLEAMALGKPVIATAVGGTTELIEHGRNGLLVPPEDPEALAKEIIGLIRDPSLPVLLTLEARRRLKDSFSPSRRAEEINRIYLGLLMDGLQQTRLR